MANLRGSPPLQVRLSYCTLIHWRSLVEYMVKKEPQSFVHCTSFDHPDLHLLNGYNFFLVY